MYYQFAQYLVDVNKLKLFHGSELIADDEKTIKLLSLLCENYPDITEKEYLINQLWPDQVVTDWSLSKLVSEVRQLLNDSGKEQEFIKTIRGRGFRFNSDVIKTEENPGADLSQTKEVKANTLSSAHTGNKYRGVIASILLVVVIVFAGFIANDKFLDTKEMNVEQNKSIRIAVLPVESNEDDPINEWITYGIMSMATDLLSQYESINTLPSSLVISTVAGINETLSLKDNYKEYFDAVCGQIGCSHIIAIRYRREHKNDPTLSYQIYQSEKQSVLTEFIETDIIDAANLMLDNLARELIPTESEYYSLENTFTVDRKANRDYAIGVNELFNGDPKSATTYLDLALKRAPNFFWAKAYLAEAMYRSGNIEKSSVIVKQLKSNELSAAQHYFIDHLSSNILYATGKLDESLAISLSLQKNSFALDDPLLMGNQLLNIGSSYQASGDLDKAILFLEKARKQYASVEFGSGEGKVLFNLANVYLARSQELKAIELYQLAREVFIKFNMPGYALMAKHQIATTSISVGKLKFVESELRQMVKQYRTLGDFQGELTSLSDLVYVSMVQQNYQEATDRAERLIIQLENTQFSYLKDHVRALAIFSYLQLNNGEMANQHFLSVKGNWVDPRPEFIFIPAHLELIKGNINKALSIAKQIKVEHAKLWTTEHQLILEQFETAVQKHEIIPIIYHTKNRTL